MASMFRLVKLAHLGDRMIRLLREEDADAYANLRREALLDAPLAFASSPDDDFISDVEAVRE